MATVADLSDPYANFMQNPAPLGAGICPVCRGFPAPGYSQDRGCGFNPHYIDALSCISYAPLYGQLHTALRGYKDNPSVEVRERFTLELAAVLWRFLNEHEACLAAAAGVAQFDVVTTVPSKTLDNDDQRDRLRRIVGKICKHTAPRYERLLIPAGNTSAGRQFDPGRFVATRDLQGLNVLLVEDMWVSGSNAQSAAYALKAAGAAVVGCVAIGRYVVPEYEDHGARLAAVPQGFSWETCAHHR